MYFNFKYGLAWYNFPTAILLVILLPITPLLFVLIVVARKIQELFYPSWMTGGPGAVFFVTPDNPIAAFIWDQYIAHSMYIGQFMLCGTHDEAIRTSMYDTRTDKYFWREKMAMAGC